MSDNNIIKSNNICAIVVNSGLIPPDITLASVCFHVRKESQIFKNNDKETVNTIYKINCCSDD
jgi:hypothetical protein